MEINEELKQAVEFDRKFAAECDQPNRDRAMLAQEFQQSLSIIPLGLIQLP